MITKIATDFMVKVALSPNWFLGKPLKNVAEQQQKKKDSKVGKLWRGEREPVKKVDPKVQADMEEWARRNNVETNQSKATSAAVQERSLAQKAEASRAHQDTLNKGSISAQQAGKSTTQQAGKETTQEAAKKVAKKWLTKRNIGIAAAAVGAPTLLYGGYKYLNSKKN